MTEVRSEGRPPAHNNGTESVGGWHCSVHASAGGGDHLGVDVVLVRVCVGRGMTSGGELRIW